MANFENFKFSDKRNVESRRTQVQTELEKNKKEIIEKVKPGMQKDDQGNLIGELPTQKEASLFREDEIAKKADLERKSKVNVDSNEESTRTMVDLYDEEGLNTPKRENKPDTNDDDKQEIPEGAQGVLLDPVEQINQKKSLEQLTGDLEEARQKVALVDIDFERTNKWLKRGKRREDYSVYDSKQELLNQLKEEYIKIINAIRAERMTQAREEISGMNLSPEQEEQELKKRAQEILKETLTLEAIELNDLEQNLRTEQRGAFGRGFEKAWKSVLGVSEKYQKMTLKKKILIAGGLMAAGATAGLAGGIFAGAVGGGVIAARWTRRALSGVGIFRGLESAVKHRQEKKTEKEAQKEFGYNLIEVLENGDEYLDQKIFSLNKQKDKERVKRYLLAAGGAILGSMAISKICGAAVREAKEYFGWGGSGVSSGAGKIETPGAGVSPETEVSPADVRPDAALAPETPPVETTPPAPDAPPPSPEASNFSSMYEVKAGGSVWKGLEEKLTEKYGNTFTDLKPGQKDYIIDKFKDYVGAHKGDFGLEDINKIKAGDKIDFSKIFGDEQGMKQAFEHAGKMSPKEIGDIEKYDSLLKQVKDSHAGAAHAAAETVVPPTVEVPSPKAPENFQPLKGAYEPFKPEDYGVSEEQIADATSKMSSDPVYDQFREAGIQHAMTDKLTEIGINSEQWEMYKGRTIQEILAMNPDGRKWGIFSTHNSALKRLQDFLTIHGEGYGQAKAGDVLRKAIE